MTDPDEQCDCTECVGRRMGCDPDEEEHEEEDLDHEDDWYRHYLARPQQSNRQTVS